MSSKLATFILLVNLGLSLGGCVMLKPLHELQVYFRSQKKEAAKVEDKGAYTGTAIPYKSILPLRSKLDKKYGIHLKHQTNLI